MVATCTVAFAEVVKLGRSPVPLAANPIEVLLFVQLKVTPDVGLLNCITGINSLAQLVKEDTEFTTGLGQLVAVQFADPDCAHGTPKGIMVMATTSPGFKLPTFKVVVALETLPLMLMPPFMVYE